MYGTQLATTKEIVCIYTSDSERSVLEIKEWCSENSIDLHLKEIGSELTSDDFTDYQTTVGISVGGDGSFLQAVREFSRHNIPLLGINSGTLAFLPRVSPSDITKALDSVIRGEVEVASRQRYKISSEDITGTGINDVMIEPPEPENPFDKKVCSLDLYIDDEYAGEYTGSGIAISTPTGSTGVALSAGGPIHYPTNNHSLQIIGLNTHSMGVRPIVVSSESEITIQPKSSVNIMLDGGRKQVSSDNKLTITGDEKRAHIIRTVYDDQFFEALSKKLNWGIRNKNTELLNTVKGSSDSKSKLDIAKEAVKSAGIPLQEYHGKVESIQHKEDKFDLVTEADHEAEELIETILSNKYPDENIYSEENWSDDIDFSGNNWVIDPLDGTGNYIHGNPNYCVSIAYIVDDVIKFGVVYQPETDELYWAKKGEGAKVNGKSIKTTKTQNLDESMLLSGYDPNGLFIQSLYEETRGIRGIGSAALNLCYIASGSAEAVWEYDTYPWDIAAGMIILEEAGGKLTDQYGEKYTLIPDKNLDNPLVASNTSIHANIIEKTKDLYPDR